MTRTNVRFGLVSEPLREDNEPDEYSVGSSGVSNNIADDARALATTRGVGVVAFRGSSS